MRLLNKILSMPMNPAKCAAFRSTALVVLLVFSDAHLAGAAGQGVAWRTNLDAARVEASQSGKLLLIHFWTPTCGPCRVLERAVFNQPQVAEGLEQNYVPVKVNADQAPALASSFQIRSVPTDVVVTTQGNVLSTMSCPDKPDAYLAQLSNLSQHYRVSVAANQSGELAPAVNAAYAGLDTGKYAALQRQAVEPPKASSKSVEPGPQQINPYFTPAAPPTASASPQTSAPRAGTLETGNGDPASAAVASTSPQVANTAVAAAAPTGAKAQGASEASLTPELPSGAAPLGFEGYCPVSLKDEHMWVKGVATVGMEHRGRTYLFASEQHRAQFSADPDSFCPVLEGMDPVVMLEERRAVEGNRRFGYKYKGVFYLFSGAESMKKFQANPGSYAQGVQVAMRQLESGSSQSLRR